MKKHIILALAATFIATPLLYGASLSDVKMTVSDAYDKLFGYRTNLYDKGITSAEWYVWNNAIKMVEDFVEKNGKDLLRRKDEVLVSSLKVIENTNARVTNVTKLFYFNKGKDRELTKSIISTLKLADRNMTAIRGVLMLKSYTLSGKKQSKELLIHTADIIKKLANKAITSAAIIVDKKLIEEVNRKLTDFLTKDFAQFYNEKTNTVVDYTHLPSFGKVYVALNNAINIAISKKPFEAIEKIIVEKQLIYINELMKKALKDIIELKDKSQVSIVQTLNATLPVTLQRFDKTNRSFAQEFFIPALQKIDLNKPENNKILALINNIKNIVENMKKIVAILKTKVTHSKLKDQPEKLLRNLVIEIDAILP